MFPFYECAICGDPYSFCGCADEIERARRRTREELAKDLARWSEESDQYRARQRQRRWKRILDVIAVMVLLGVAIAFLWFRR